MKAEIVFRPGARRIGYSVAMGDVRATARQLVTSGRKMLEAFAEAPPMVLEADVEFRDALNQAVGGLHYKPDPNMFDGVPVVTVE